ncbi:MAG TPA: xanthine dehydrogenase family protein molybdopterin-binding subunit [Solirubrobacteraceae bacterium]|nr:xanthine dehydrogenase family protein molybdopterin-binding subunit [Solirubrobacteraceae bacterium]
MSTTVDGAATNGSSHVGRALRRKEDPRLMTGRASYVDDINLVGQLWAAWVRSPEAHAKIVSIDTSSAKARDGIWAVYTNADLDMEAGLPMAWVPPGVTVNTPDHWVLAKDEVKHVGDPVALVIGDDRYAVVDAAEDVVVEYEPLPVVTDPEEALKEGSPLVHPQFGTNKVCDWSLGGGDLEAGFAEADVIIERRIVNHRVAGAAIEPRGVLAEFRADRLTVWSSTQVPHFLRLFLAILLGIGEDRVRAVAPEVGGAFGSKLQIYAEEIGCAWASRKLGRPVKWIETRSEGMMVTHHGRDQIDYVRVGAKRDGTITAWHSKIIADLGAYQMVLTPAIPPSSAFVMCGVYKTPAVHTDIVMAMTNKFPTDAIRGAGRPEAAHMIEVVMDQLAHELGMDPLDLRRKNFIAPFSEGHETPIGVVYDSGNYEAALDRLLEHIDPAQVRVEASALRERGIYRGIGFCTYTEICGNSPSKGVGPSGFGLQCGGWESATVRVHPTGSATLYTGTSPHGQGHETGFAQIVADRLGVDPSQVEVIHGDTQTGPSGLDTYGSRSLSVGGEAASRAANKVAAKAREIVAHQLEAEPEDIELRDGRFSVRGSPDKGMTLAEVAGAAYVTMEMPEGMEPGLNEQSFYDPSNWVFPFGAHACVVDVDGETGKVEIVRYVAVDDCGRAVNPMLVEGQVHGGVTQGIGQALYERIHYDDSGQLVTGTFVDYALPTAAELPSFETDRTETPSPVNSLGVKGVGEAGTIAASATVTNAVLDALRPLGVDFINMPLSPMRIWEAIQEAKGGVPA